MALAKHAEAWLSRLWWQPRPTPLARALAPLADALQGLARRQAARARAQPLPVPVLVVGNLIVGGAGKTPTVIALAQALRLRGWRPGVISRGYGRGSDELVLVDAGSDARQCGDEPLLIHLRGGVPVAVARQRTLAAQALLARHPEVDLLIADDGLQHAALWRDAQVVVFDARGCGNGLPLPAGPLRQAMPRQPPPRSLVLYNADTASTPWPGALATRRLAGAVALQDWWQGQPPSEPVLRQLAASSAQRPLLAAAGMGQPERFFGMLEAAGLRIARLPLPDHAAFDPLPWPAGTPDVLLTEKDAVKLRPGEVGATRVWVVALDFRLPEDFVQAVDDLLRASPARQAPRADP